MVDKSRRLAVLVLSHAGLLASSVCTGCAAAIDTQVPDAHVEPPPVVETRFLEIEGEHDLALVFEEDIQLAVRYLNADRMPIQDAEVRFSFEGRAHDSSLSSVEATTDELGLASVRLRAGTSDAAFRVRAAGVDAAPVFFLVAISDNGFGELSVVVRYEGDRDVRLLGVGVFPELNCADISERERGDHFQAIGPDNAPAEFRALPANVPMAVAARAEGATREALAYSCIDDVTIEADARREEQIEVEDLPLVVEGSYRGALALDTSRASGLLLESAFDEATAMLAERSGAARVLDAAEASLREAGLADDAESLARARRDDDLDAVLASTLRRSMAGPQIAVLRAREFLAPRIDSVTFDGVLRIAGAADDGTAGETSFDVQQVLVGTAETAEPIDVDVVASVTSEVNEDVTVLSLQSVSFPLSASALFAAVLNLESADADVPTTIVDFANCTALPSVEMLATMCDVECLRAACNDVVGALNASVESALERLDRSRSRFDVSGEVPLSDSNSDRRVDMLSAGLSAAWGSAAEPGISVGVEFAAERVNPPR